MPGNTAQRLYSNGGNLYWAGNLVAPTTPGNWTSDGTNVWRAGGYVGVGTSSPWGLLSINPNAIGSSPQFVIGSSTATNFIVTNGGKVGIGTSNPAATLAISGKTSVPTALYISQPIFTYSGADTSSAILSTGTFNGASTNHARGWNNTVSVGGSVTYDMIAYNNTNTGTGEVGELIGSNTMTGGGNGWGVDLVNAIPADATNGNLSQTTGMRIVLNRNVAASGGGFDRGVTVENIGTVQGKGAAYGANGF